MSESVTQEALDVAGTEHFIQRERRQLAAELEALFTVACLTHGNWPKSSTANAVFVPGLAVDNWQETPEDDGILHTAARLYHEHRVPFIAIPGNSGTYPEGPSGPRSETGYPGWTVWQAALRERGVPPEVIVPYAETTVGPDGGSWNTRTEVDAFVSVAKQRTWNTIVILCSPFHLLRVMLTLVKACLDVDFRPRLSPVTPRSVSWSTRAYHSQGLQQLPRHAHIAEEWRRVPTYQANGSICTFRALAQYLLLQHAAS